MALKNRFVDERENLIHPPSRNKLIESKVEGSSRPTDRAHAKKNNKNRIQTRLIHRYRIIGGPQRQVKIVPETIPISEAIKRAEHLWEDEPETRGDSVTQTPADLPANSDDLDIPYIDDSMDLTVIDEE